jgi:hypothetical protein
MTQMASTKRFTDAITSGDGAAIAAALSPDLVFRSPILTGCLHGPERAAAFLGPAESIVDRLTYYDTVEAGDRAFLLWRGKAFERDIEGATVIVAGDDGLVVELTVLMRSWTVVGMFRDAMLVATGQGFDRRTWMLGDERVSTPDPQGGVGPPAQRALAPQARFHSPMLTRTISGEENLRAIHAMIGAIQGPREYLARVDQPSRSVELWRCVIEGHELWGLDVFDLDDDGLVSDQRVWLRPWPVTTLLRDRAMASQLPILGVDAWLSSPHMTQLA